ncbi:unnamed protein product [Acanthosepion pharaonis]|uniref:Helitron helicase-like domain-containing protein n=1 Tax=Acanthosepion pharaonis TaxID=158019 RepID=A0A812EM66_ACAPH|nr:unnamed protein product [Sepia pharaonis]
MPPKRRKLWERRPEHTSLRLSRMASSSAARLSTESAAARTERLASAASTMSAVEERSLQNSQDAVHVARLRDSQSPAQKTLRHLREATAKACSRGLQSPEQTTSRRLRNTRATAASRASEQPQETTHRRFRNALSTASARALESLAQTTVPRVRNARSTRSVRALEIPSQTTVRRVRNARSTASARDLESPAQTTVHRVRNARSTASARAAENSEPLRDLLLGTTLESTHFLEAIRKYNCCFQMTSFGAKAISEGGWMPTFKVQGQVYHLMGSLLADQREPPQFLQIYFLADYNEQVDARLGILPSDISVGPRRDILFLLQDMLHETNSYIRSLKFALQNNSSPSFSVVIDADRRPHGEHKRRFNAPVCNEVVAVIHGTGAVVCAASVKPNVHTTVSCTPFFFHTEAMDSYIHLRDGLPSDVDPRNLGKLCILPSCYTGGPRYMHERTPDAMTYVRHYGRPDLFVTFTCNPKWVEITRELFPGQQYSHRPDLIARVFRLQLCKLMDLILKGQVF